MESRGWYGSISPTRCASATVSGGALRVTSAGSSCVTARGGEPPGVRNANRSRKSSAAYRS